MRQVLAGMIAALSCGACHGTIDSDSLRADASSTPPTRDAGVSADASTGTASPTTPQPSAAGRPAVVAGVPAAAQAGSGSVPDAGASAFEALVPAVYVAKVKGLLTGLAPTADDIRRVERDPAALRELIATWQQQPEYATHMVDFFTTAFQQGDVTAAMNNNVTPFEQGEIDKRVIANMRESFGRTAMQLVNEGKPFTDVLTTRRFMLTPALMLAMTWLEERQSGDGGGVNDALNRELGDTATWTMQGDQPVAIEESTNPASAHFLKFYSTQLAAATGDCHKPIVVDTKDNRLTLYTATFGETMMSFFMGNSFGSGFCRYPALDTVLNDSDFQTWRMVTIRAPGANEKRTWVYEISRFRGGGELVYTKPHVGFYTTPAFLYTWQTNDSNQARVTVNQTLIVATGRRFDALLSATPTSEAAVAKEHALPNTFCYACHLTMDPMRQYFRNTYSYYWGLQENRAELERPGIYAFDGESHTGADIADLGKSLAASQRFATGWAHKLCVFANAAVCDPSGNNLRDPTDPAFVRIVQAFRDNHYDWNKLVQDLFSSPLVTYAAATDTTRERGMSFSVAKKSQLCKLFDQRLGLDDVCGLRALPSTATGDPIRTIATVLPSDSYSRGQTVPTLANDPGLFFYAGVENMCATLSRRVIDNTKGASKWQGAETPAAIGGMVHELMGLWPPRDTDVIALLTEHASAARAEGANATEALRSTFVLACMSPAVVGVGQ
ncbi:MAG: hypothetical protein RL701_7919 [Pseudomonadota bacterium]